MIFLGRKGFGGNDLDICISCRNPIFCFSPMCCGWAVSKHFQAAAGRQKERKRRKKEREREERRKRERRKREEERKKEKIGDDNLATTSERRTEPSDGSKKERENPQLKETSWFCIATSTF